MWREVWGVWKKGLCVKMEVEVGCVEVGVGRAER